MGIKKNDSVLIHSSLSSFGYVKGGEAAVVNALSRTVGEDGLVIFPTLTGKDTDSPAHPPVFDVMETPCWTGRIPEFARHLPQALRSLHPTHSVAVIGSRKENMVSGHETGDSPCDSKSPYYKNAMWGGYIMLVGVDQESNTTVHCCEEMAKVPYHLQKEKTTMKLKDYKGNEVTVINRLHDWGKPETDFNKIECILETNNAIKKYKVGNSTIRLIKAGEMLDVVVNKLIKEPYYMLV
jgi:aminoglycoside 3-N-acetyltransferase